MKKVLEILKACPNAAARIALLILCYILQTVFQLAQAEVLNRSAKVIESRSAAVLQQTMMLACIVLAGSLFVEAFLKLTLRKFQNDTVTGVQKELLSRVMSFKRSHFLKNDPSVYLTGITDFADSMVGGAVRCFTNSCASSVMLVGCVLYMAYLSIPLTVIVVSFNVVLRLLLRIAEKQVRKNVSACNQVVRKNNSFLIEILENMMTVRVFQEGEYFQEKLFEREKDTYRSRIRSFAWSNGISEFIWCTLKFAEFVLVYGVGGILLYHGRITFGLFLSFPLAMDYFVKAINQLLFALIDKNTALAARENLNFLYEEAETEEEADMTPSLSQEIRLEHVSFGYALENGEQKEILKDVSFTIAPGDKVLLQGQNGQGKSTLLYLLSGQFRPDSGEIYYGEEPLSGKNLAAISQSHALITQEHNMLPCSVMQNMALDEQPDEERCMHLLEKFRMEYASDRRASVLSQGEKQRVNISRAFYKRKEGPVVLLGDEILANIDPDNADHVLTMIEETFADDTVIMVCHGDTGFRWNKRITVEHGTAAVEER